MMRNPSNTRRQIVASVGLRNRKKLASAALIALAVQSAQAASAWKGTGTTAIPTSGTWNLASDWSPATIPASSTTTELDFSGSSAYTSTDDISGAFQLNFLNLSSTGGVIAASAGNSLAFSGTSPHIQQSAAGTFTITAPVSSSSSLGVSAVNNGEIDFGGAVSGSAITATNTSGTGNAILKFSGANSFAGLTVNPHVTVIAANTTSMTTLGSGTVTLAGGTLQLQGQQTSGNTAVQQTESVSGFTQDIIYENLAGSPGTVTTKIDGGETLYEHGISGTTNGLPAGNSAFTSGATASQGNGFISGVKFQLGAYNANNALSLKGPAGTNGTLTLGSQTPFKSIDFLYCGSYGGPVTATLNFSDGSSTPFTFTASDWYGSNSETALSTGSYTGSSANPWGGNLDQVDYTLSTGVGGDSSKILTGVNFSLGAVAGNFFNVLAVSGAAFSVGASPSQTYANNVSVTADSTINVTGSLTATMGNLSIGSNKLSVTSSDPTAAAYSLTLGATTLSGNATFDVSNSTGGGAGTLNLGALNDGGTARTITINPTGTGSVVLATNAASLVAGTIISIQHGTLNSNSATAIGTNATVNLSASGTFALGANQQISALTGAAGSVTLGNKTLTIGSTDNLSGSFGGVISGAGLIQTAGTGTVTLSGDSTYASNYNSNGQVLPTSTVINTGTVVAAGPSIISNGTITSGPLGTADVVITSGPSGTTDALYLDNTPGRVLPNSIYIGSSGPGTPTLGGLNTSGVTTFSGPITLGTGNSGDYGHPLAISATAGGEVDFTGNIVGNTGGTATANGNTPITVNNLSGSGSAIVNFTGNNSYAGATTVNPNVTLAAGPSPYSTAFGTGPIKLAGGNLSLRGLLAAGAQQTIPVTGYLADTIIDQAASPTSATISSTGTPTSKIDASTLFFENGYNGDSAHGLPNGGAIPATTNTHAFQLAPYTDNNTLRYTSANISQNLSLTTPSSFQTLDFLATSQGAAAFSVTLNFTTGPSDTIGGFTTHDWYGGLAGHNAVSGLDPVNQNLGIIYNGTGAPPNDANYFGALTMQEYDLTLPAADQSKTISSITFTSTSVSGSSAEIYAVSGATAAPTPLPNQTYANNITISANSAIDISGSLAATMGNLTLNGGSTLSVTSADTTNSPYSLTLGGITQTAGAHTMGFNISNSAGGGTGTLIVGAYNDQGVVQTITKSGSGALTFTQDAISMVNGTIINVTGGTLNSNSAAALGTLTVVNLSNATTFNVGADQVLGGLSDDASPTLNSSSVKLNGHTLTVGNITDVTSTYSGVISDGTGALGTGGLTKNGGGVLTLAGASTYTGNTNVSFGTLALTGSLATQSLTVVNGATANINGSLTATPAVTVGGTLNFGAGTSGILVRKLGTLNVSGAVNIAPITNHANRTVVVTSGLTNTGLIDLSNNDLVVQNTTASTLFSQLQAGFNAGAGYWNGLNGIISTSAASDTRFLTTIGYRQSSGGTFDTVATTTNDTLVKYTYYGDANLDGVVNGADYQQIDMGFGSGATGWSSGDFNYDGVINGSDFALIDNTFNQITATGASSLAVVADSSSVLATPAAITAVPEPTMLGFIGIGTIGLLRRARRRRTN